MPLLPPGLALCACPQRGGDKTAVAVLLEHRHLEEHERLPRTTRRPMKYEHRGGDRCDISTGYVDQKMERRGGKKIFPRVRFLPSATSTSHQEEATW